ISRAIIVSKGRVVADGPLDEIRARTGRVRYVITVAEGRAEGDKRPPDTEDVEEALRGLPGVRSVRSLPTDEKVIKVEVSGAQDGDIRADMFRLAVARGWTLLELRRDAQSLDAVFRDLTRGDEKLDRGADWKSATEDGADADDEDEDLDDDDDEDEDD